MRSSSRQAGRGSVAHTEVVLDAGTTGREGLHEAQGSRPLLDAVDHALYDQLKVSRSDLSESDMHLRQGGTERLLFDGFREPVEGELSPDLSRPGLGIELKRKDAERFRRGAAAID
jgi:hypothetical protein